MGDVYIILHVRAVKGQEPCVMDEGAGDWEFHVVGFGDEADKGLDRGDDGHRIEIRTVVGNKQERLVRQSLAPNMDLDADDDEEPLEGLLDDAVVKVDKYLDDAYVAHISPVRIVHGKGTGALRKAVHQYLKSQKNISEFRLGEYGEGDAGVTIVKFK